MLRKSNLPAARPLIYLITAGEATDENFESKSLEILRLIESAVSAGILLIQIREKRISARLLFELSQRAAKITKNTDTKLLVNGRADIAYLSGADGVHLPADSIPVKAIRSSFGQKFIIGASVHSLNEAKVVEESDADFITFGPVFKTPSKAEYGEPQYLGRLREMTQEMSIPVIAIGGIDAGNCESVLRNEAAGFAAIRFLQDSEKLTGIVQNLK